MGNQRTEINKRWQEKNKERSNYLKYRSIARSFIRSKATRDDLLEFQELIKIKMLDTKE